VQQLADALAEEAADEGAFAPLSTAAFVGIVVGGVALLALVVAIVLVAKWKSAKRSSGVAASE
jgi:hypothetical protein